MKQWKRITLLTLVAAMLLLSLTACGENYDLRESTEREATPVLTLGEDTVNFELLYTFFLSQCERIEGFNGEYFTGEGGDARFAAVMAAARAEIAEIYAVFALCREVGIDPYDQKIEAEILEHLKSNVEGGTYGGYEIEGFKSYDAYITYLRETYHMNDAVNRLMLRYAICEERLIDYYDTRFPFTKEDVTAFFESEDCVHVIWVGREAKAYGFNASENYEQMERARKKLLEGDHRGAIQHSTNPTTDFYMGRYTKDKAFYDTLIETVYELEIDETSEILDLGTEGYFLVKRLHKEAIDLDDRYEEILDVFLFEKMYSRIESMAVALDRDAAPTDTYRTLTAKDFLDNE